MHNEPIGLAGAEWRRFPPTRHIYHAGKVPWLELAGDLPRHGAGAPEPGPGGGGGDGNGSGNGGGNPG
ncbi:MAG: hypothetical protein V3S64_12455 [bacterium]